MYSIKEIYKTIQGEGAFSGRPAVFCRFAGCNLWTGREEDRANAICQFCDTDFVGTNGENGGKYGADELAETLDQCWSQSCADTANKFVVFTGGEPLLSGGDLRSSAVHEKTEVKFDFGFYGLKKHTREDSNLQPSVPKTDALSN